MICFSNLNQSQYYQGFLPDLKINSNSNNSYSVFNLNQFHYLQPTYEAEIRNHWMRGEGGISVKLTEYKMFFSDSLFRIYYTLFKPLELNMLFTYIICRWIAWDNEKSCTHCIYLEFYQCAFLKKVLKENVKSHWLHLF